MCSGSSKDSVDFGGLTISTPLSHYPSPVPVTPSTESTAARTRQLKYLLELAERTTIEIRVLPLTAGAHAAVNGSFDLLDMPSPYSAIAQIDTAANIMMYLEAEQIEPLIAAYDDVRNRALGRGDSVELIRSAAKENG